MTHFYSTQNKNIRVTLEEAVMKGLAEDGGLFMPTHITRMPDLFFKRIDSLSFSEICLEVSKTILQQSVPLRELKRIIEKTITFDAPLKALSAEVYSLELFHGPTLSFKDFGAHFMAQLMGYFIQGKNQVFHILVATTSGDTGGAIAQAFLHVPGIRVWILYPKGKVSLSQEQQMTTIGHNITALEIEGTFDDCQNLVKQAFSDPELRQQLHLTSANSINIARLIPQSFYYFYAYAQIKQKSSSLIFSVPSGNFGNLTAGLLAKRMGLPVTQFVAATNINDSIPRYLKSGIFEPHPSKHTLSNAMDVGNPSNFARMRDLYDDDLKKMNRDLSGISFTDNQTKNAIRDIFTRYGYLLDPHGAIAYLGLQSLLSKYPEKMNGIFLETAHPAKFAEDVEKITEKKIRIPERLKEALSKQKQSIVLNTEYEEFRSLLLRS